MVLLPFHGILQRLYVQVHQALNAQYLVRTGEQWLIIPRTVTVNVHLTGKASLAQVINKVLTLIGHSYIQGLSFLTFGLL